MSLSSYIKETRVEMKHVSWPTRRQAVTFTAIIIGISLIVAVLLGLFDFAFAQVVEVLIGKFIS